MKLSILNWFINSEMGINPGKLLRFPLRFLFWIKDYVYFIKLVPRGYKIDMMPSIHDKFEQSASINNEYFWQDLICSQYIYSKFKELEQEHYDIGSRVDGFVASVATFTVCNVFDIRAQKSEYRNINFLELDLTNQLPENFLKKAVTLSCLHTLEHIGLGRYGDSVSFDSWKMALKNMSLLLSNQNSEFLLSTLCGKPKVFYNSHRIFSVDELMREFSINNLEISLVAINDRVHTSNFVEWQDTLNHRISTSDYCLVIFVLKRNYDKI